MDELSLGNECIASGRPFQREEPIFIWYLILVSQFGISISSPKSGISNMVSQIRYLNLVSQIWYLNLVSQICCLKSGISNLVSQIWYRDWF